MFFTNPKSREQIYAELAEQKQKERDRQIAEERWRISGDREQRREKRERITLITSVAAIAISFVSFALSLVSFLI